MLIGQATKVCNGIGEWTPITHTNCGKIFINIFSNIIVTR